ncbi:MAG: stage 0 sporulation family protein [Lachnospiraceae bacterium]
MVKVIGVRFRQTGKIYYFDPLKFEISVGDHVIVETVRGVEYGTVMIADKMVEEENIVDTLKPVIRIATPEDDEKHRKNREKSKEALRVCSEKVKEHQLDMKLVDAEYTFDNNKVLFYFTADGRVDFRDLVKDLAAVFRTRIELRQIGVRDETKLCGGLGVCGRELCCHTFLADFAPVSIKMAKEQNLSLNPTKISGTCGRLMCCLKNEQESYEYLNSSMPYVGDDVETLDGMKGKVFSVNVLRQLVKVVFEDEKGEKEVVEYRADELKFKPRKKKIKISEKEKKKMESLEKQEAKEGGSVL